MYYGTHLQGFEKSRNCFNSEEKEVGTKLNKKVSYPMKLSKHQCNKCPCFCCWLMQDKVAGIAASIMALISKDLN